MNTRNADRSNGKSNGSAGNADTGIEQPEFEVALALQGASPAAAQAVGATRGDPFSVLDAHADQVRERVMRAMRDVDEIHPERMRDANALLVREALQAVQLAKLAVRQFGVMAHSSRHDALTGTPDRVVMHDRLEQAIALARRRGTRIAVFFVDLDDFKRINDTLGHAAGDEVLRLVARRLESVVRDSDTVSRHGGDEFLVLLADVAQASDVIAVAASMLSALAEPARVDGHALTLSGSLGVALFPEDGEDPDSLIARADAAMYRAKRAGGNAFRSCSDAMMSVPTPAHAHGAGQARSREASPAVGDEAGSLDPRAPGEGSGSIAPAARERVARERDANRHRPLSLRATANEVLQRPLESIRQSVALLEHAPVDAAQINRLRGIIEGQLANVSRLIEQLHDGVPDDGVIGEGDRGALVRTHPTRFPCGTVDLADILGLAVARSRPTLAARRQVLTRQLAPGAVAVHGDAVRLAQAFTRLLDNASTHTPSGGEISLATCEQPATVTVTVSDNGFGIVPEALPDIFEERLHDTFAMTRGNRGAGVGLAVVRDLVETYGGTVAALSAGKNMGSSFVVTLPKV